MNNENKEPPVREGDVLDLQIVGIGKKGDGVGKVDGFAIIIPETEQNQTYKVKITKVYPNVAFATVCQE